MSISASIFFRCWFSKVRGCVGRELASPTRLLCFLLGLLFLGKLCCVAIRPRRRQFGGFSSQVKAEHLETQFRFFVQIEMVEEKLTSLEAFGGFGIAWLRSDWTRLKWMVGRMEWRGENKRETIPQGKILYGIVCPDADLPCRQIGIFAPHPFLIRTV